MRPRPKDTLNLAIEKILICLEHGGIRAIKIGEEKILATTNNQEILLQHIHWLAREAYAYMCEEAQTNAASCVIALASLLSRAKHPPKGELAELLKAVKTAYQIEKK